MRCSTFQSQPVGLFSARGHHEALQQPFNEAFSVAVLESPNDALVEGLNCCGGVGREKAQLNVLQRYSAVVRRTIFEQQAGLAPSLRKLLVPLAQPVFEQGTRHPCFLIEDVGYRQIRAPSQAQRRLELSDHKRPHSTRRPG